MCRVESGYTGGTVKNPSYNEICTGETGHAEVAKITYDPDIISFANELEIDLPELSTRTLIFKYATETQDSVQWADHLAYFKKTRAG